MVNGRVFSMDELHRPSYRMPLGSLQEWSLDSADYNHPVHMHVFHFQVVALPGGAMETMGWRVKR